MGLQPVNTGLQQNGQYMHNCVDWRNLTYSSYSDCQAALTQYSNEYGGFSCEQVANLSCLLDSTFCEIVSYYRGVGRIPAGEPETVIIESQNTTIAIYACSKWQNPVYDSYSFCEAALPSFNETYYWWIQLRGSIEPYFTPPRKPDLGLHKQGLG
jgi:hypothetical protein